MGNLHISHHCCIHDSSFNKSEDKETINSKNEWEKEPFKIAEQLIDTGKSIMSDYSPRKYSKNKVDDD